MIAARIAAVLAVLCAAVLMFGPGRSDPYHLTLYFENASQLVRGNEVKVGGVPIGKVDSIALTPDYRARVKVTLDGHDELVPLRRGTVAAIRNDALASVAGRYIALTPGPAGAPKVRDGGSIGTDDTRSTIDTDQVLATLDRPTRRNLRALIRHGETLLGGGASAQANAAFRALSPATSQGSALARELNRDQGALARLVRESGGVASALASRPAELESLTGDARAAVDAVARQSRALDSSLVQLPPTLRRTNTTLVNVRSALSDLRPLVRDARPAAAPLTRTLMRLAPVARRARAVVPRLRHALRRPGRANDVVDALRGIAPVRRQAVPAFRSTARLLRDLQPVVTELRPYVPDLVGFAQAFTGTTGGYYDANGRYVRISLQASLFTGEGANPLVPLPSADGLAGLRQHVDRRCPGAATQPLPDRSNPFFEVPGVCDPGDDPR